MRRLAVGLCVALFACAANAVTSYVASEDFEGAFPQAGWQVYDNDGASNGEYYWVDTNVVYFDGGWSGWCAGGGADGSSLSPGTSDYPPNCDSWLVTPWLDLTDAGSAMVDFFYLLDSELDYDFLEVVVYDGTDYYSEWSQSGYAAVWTYAQVDLTAYAGSTVQVAFVFTSDATNEYTGAFIDWIDVTKDADDNYEENDTRAAAYDLSAYESTWLSAIDGYGACFDQDWYTIYVLPGYERVVIDCTFTHAEGDIDIELVDEFGATVASSMTTSDNEHIDCEVGLGGVYYILVDYFGTPGGNDYDLLWYTTTPDDDDDGGVLIVCGRTSDASGLGAALMALLLLGGAAGLRRRPARQAA